MASLSCSDLHMVPCPLTQKETESHCSTVPKNGESWKLLLLQERTRVFLSFTLCLKLIFRWSVISLSWSSCLVFILEKTSVPRHISREDHGSSLGEVPSRWQMPPNPQHGASLVLSSHSPARTWNLGGSCFPPSSVPEIQLFLLPPQALFTLWLSWLQMSAPPSCWAGPRILFPIRRGTEGSGGRVTHSFPGWSRQARVEVKEAGPSRWVLGPVTVHS